MGDTNQMRICYSGGKNNFPGHLSDIAGVLAWLDCLGISDARASRTFDWLAIGFSADVGYVGRA